MQTRTHNPFTTIHTEGALLPTDLLQRVLAVDPKLDGLSAADYHLPAGEKLNEAINRSWNRLQGSWATFFRTSRARLDKGDAGTTLTRERWLLPLFQELGYGRLQTSKAIELDGKSYPISHKWGDTPIHLVGCGIELDKRTPGAAGASRSSPHSLLQELLNRSPEFLWGLVSNGLRLRVLRDNASLTRQAFLEFDLESMFEGEIYSDFAVLWLICHQSRVEGGADGARPCWLEAWSKAAQEQGTRALKSLRQGVEGAIKALGSGFLRHPANQKLRLDLRSGALDKFEYYRQLLRLVYRLIFLFVVEDRDLLFDPASSPEARGRYLRHYSLGRLRRLAERSRGGRHPDLYVALRLVTDILGGRKDSGMGKTGLGLPVLGGFLFAGEALRDLESAELDNESLLSAIRHLILMDEGRTRRAVDYKNLGSEELGSVYESLLELHPLVNTDAATFELISVSGSERKETGSYYTPSSLIQVLLDSALEPVIENALKHATTDDRPQTMEGDCPSSVVDRQERALLSLKICDPACGSGHFLVAAAHRLARRLAAVRTGEGEPAPEAQRSALRAVISNCIYGVDVNPMSVELCKVSLWMEALEPGKPLSFLDAHIQCGDSLVGVAPGLDISEIPDEAFNMAFGDDKATASALKKRNKAERGGQMGLDVFVVRDEQDLEAWIAQQAESVDALPEETLEQVGQKAHNYQEYLDSPQFQRRKLEYDLWTAAFFWKIEAQSGMAGILAPTQEMVRRHRAGGTLPPELIRCVEELAERLSFLHWELRFPKVFTGDNPGFDCVLGNPPWERIKLQEEEFFAASDPEIAKAPNRAVSQKLINALTHSNPALARAFDEAKHTADCTSKIIRFSNRFSLTGSGDVNTYALFSELVRNLIAHNGRSGIIVPTGIATDDTTKDFFGDVITKGDLVSLFDFENREGIFPGVHRSYKFCLFTLCATTVDEADFAFFCSRIEHLKEPKRRFKLSPNEIILFNPNTRTMPVFRTYDDAELTKKIYQRTPVFVNETLGKNDWGVSFLRMIDPYKGKWELISREAKTKLEATGIDLLPIYEGKMFFQYDHRFASVVVTDNIKRPAQPELISDSSKVNPNLLAVPQYWTKKEAVKFSLEEIGWNFNWLLVQKKVTSSTNERTHLATILPLSGTTESIHCFILESKINPTLIACLLSNLNSLPFDFVARQKLGGDNFNYFVTKQLPVLPPSAYTIADIAYLAPRVLELVYTAYDLRPFAEDMGYYGEPFRWDEIRRAQLRAELDAYYARLYGLTRDELRYILDPKEVHGEDFPGETFRVLKDKEIRLYGEFRTRRLVLEAWDKLEGVQAEGYKDSDALETKGEKVELQAVSMANESAASKPAPVVKKNPAPAEENPAQPMLSDFGLYKCPLCRKMVMGYEKEEHVEDMHSQKEVQWIRIK